MITQPSLSQGEGNLLDVINAVATAATAARQIVVNRETLAAAVLVESLGQVGNSPPYRLE